MNKKEYRLMAELEETHWWFVAKRNFISSLFPQIKNLKILDVGAGTGGTTRFLQKYGKVVGIEKSGLAIKLAEKKGITLKKGNAGKLPFKKDSFDMVTIFDVLYHKDIERDIKVINKAYEILKPSGYLIITDSALELLRSSHDDIVQARQRYTLAELTKKVEAVGFEIERASYIFFFIFPLIFVVRTIGKFSKKAESDLKEVPKAVNKTLIRLCQIEASLLKYFDFPIGSSVIIKARKL